MARVLLIDDEQDLLQACAMVLEYEGHDIALVADPSQAEDVAREFRPDIAVLDWVMPGRSGSELYPSLRAALGDGVPIILSSALPGVDGEARRLGAAGFLAKPFSADALLGLVDRAAPLT